MLNIHGSISNNLIPYCPIVSTLTMSKIICYCGGSPKNVWYFSRAMVHYRQPIDYLIIPIALSIQNNDDAKDCKRLTHLYKIVYVLISVPFVDTFNCLHDM